MALAGMAGAFFYFIGNFSIIFTWLCVVTNQNESKQRCDVRMCGLRLENFDGING